MDERREVIEKVDDLKENRYVLLFFFFRIAGEEKQV